MFIETDTFAFRLFSPMEYQFRAIGVSYLNTPINLREKLAFPETTSKLFLNKLREVYGITEAIVLSTCNRTEIYFSSEQSLEQEVIKLMCLEKGLSYDNFLPHCVRYDHKQAINHLFRVSLGLEAKVLGDIQIINQVKQSYQWVADENMAGPFLHHLMHSIFFANKRITQETSFRDGSGSTASVAVDLIKTLSNVINDPRVLLIGTGEIGQNVLENLKQEFNDITLVNRTKQRALDLASNQMYRVADYENLLGEVNKADVVISAVSVGAQLFEKEDLAPSLSQKLLLDLSVPRSIHENVEEVNGIMLYNIDQIEEKTTLVLGLREKATPKVEAILIEQLEDFRNWSEEMEVSPTIKLIKIRLEQIRQDELARHLKKITPQEAKLLDSVTKSMIQKVIKLPVLELKAACKRGEAENLVEALGGIFNLEKDSTASA